MVSWGSQVSSASAASVAVTAIEARGLGVAIAREIHCVLKCPADAQRLHTRKARDRGIVEVIDDPVQRRDFHVAIDALENVEELTDRCVEAIGKSDQDVAILDFAPSLQLRLLRLQRSRSHRGLAQHLQRF